MSVPRRGPIRVDCRSLSVDLTLKRVRKTVRCIRKGARLLVVRLDDAPVVDALRAWAREHGAPFEVTTTGIGWEVQVYLLPLEFGEPPSASWRELATPLSAAA